MLALIGGLSDDIRDQLDSAESAGSPPAIDLAYLFDQVIPGLLDQSGMLGNLRWMLSRDA